ncbi:MAG TPA: guanine permease [Bacteroidales bacterium]|nr:guanine permease [Bacteroidales bacterium]
MISKFFEFDSRKTSYKKEILGGATTFLTMAYIVFVNPTILSEAGMDKSALISVTIWATIIGTLLAAFWANVPFAMAPGMGINAFFTYSLVIGQGVNWQTALGVVFLSGILFLILTFSGFRTLIVKAIPLSLRIATGAGIGLFIAFIGFKNMGLVVHNPATLVGLGTSSKPLFISLFGLFLTSVMLVRKVNGAIFYGIILTTLLALFFGEIKSPEAFFSAPPSMAPLFFKLDILSAMKWSLMGAVFSFMFVDLFDSVGSIVACSYEAGFVDSKGNVRYIDRVLEADAAATVIGSLLGTSTTTTYVESATGIANGARTGFASLVTALLFAFMLFASSWIGIVPSFATAPALVLVGVYMFKHFKDIHFADLSEAIPAFLTLILMPLTYSISVGLSFGFVTYVIVKLALAKYKDISGLMYFIALFSLINLYLNFF